MSGKVSGKIRKNTNEKIDQKVYFYLVLSFFVAFVQIAWKLLLSVFPDIPDVYGTHFMDVIMGIGAIFLWKTTDFVQPWLGLRVEKGKGRQTALTCALIAVGITAVFVAARLVLQNYLPEIAARPFFKPYFDINQRGFYPLIVLVQEILAKGVLQHGMEKTLPNGKQKTAILITMAIFGMLHIHTSPYYILGAMGLALVSGFIYYKQRNIWASVILHFFLAFFPRCFGLK